MTVRLRPCHRSLAASLGRRRAFSLQPPSLLAASARSLCCSAPLPGRTCCHAWEKLPALGGTWILPGRNRSEEHTSELQSRLHLVCRLLLEKKKKTVQATRIAG